MSTIQYIKFSEISAEALLEIVNQESIRQHLIAHPAFTQETLNAWIADKIEADAEPGCRVRVISVDSVPVGWCGIQKSGIDYELAIILAKTSWGLGPKVFREMLAWAKEFGHNEVVIHLLDSRPEYQFLKKTANRVEQSQLLGRQFTSYYLTVDS